MLWIIARPCKVNLRFDPIQFIKVREIQNLAVPLQTCQRDMFIVGRAFEQLPL